MKVMAQTSSHVRSFTSTILYTKQGGVLMRTHLRSAQHMIPSSLGSITPDMDTSSGHYANTYVVTRIFFMVVCRLCHASYMYINPRALTLKYTVSSPQNN